MTYDVFLNLILYVSLSLKQHKHTNTPTHTQIKTTFFHDTFQFHNESLFFLYESCLRFLETLNWRVSRRKMESLIKIGLSCIYLLSTAYNYIESLQNVTTQNLSDRLRNDPHLRVKLCTYYRVGLHYFLFYLTQLVVT